MLIWARRSLKPVTFVVCLLPLLLLIERGIGNDLGANPLETVIHSTGEWGLRMLLLTLAVTPVRRLSGWRWPLQIRRMLGLFVFLYVSLHLLAWAWLGQQWQFNAMLEDIAKRPYITVGFLAWLLLLPLALTSNRWSIRRLGKRWSTLHKAVYLIAILAVLHFLWLVKADLLEPLVYGTILLILLLLRVRRPLLR